MCVVFIFGKCWEYKPCIKQELEFQMEFCGGGMRNDSGDGLRIAALICVCICKASVILAADMQSLFRCRNNENLFSV